MLTLKEGDMVMGKTTEGMVHGMIEHIMIEGGTLGTPGTEFAIESMPPDNPAMSVRIYIEKDGTWKPTAFSIGMMYKDAVKIESDHSMDKSEELYESDNEDEDRWDNLTKACVQALGNYEDHDKLNKKIYKKVLPEIKLDKSVIK